ncbi:hypothetical protein FQN54_003073 [Arachnomyces sp. PD_36]|nr:hypothetical protein FQN54_003073 [Arachnomyces sp. PD_36]
MVAKLSLLLSVVATARFGLCETTVNSTSFNDIINRFPKCGVSCYNDFYGDVLEERCGDDARTSTDLRDAACICREGRNGEIDDEAKDSLTPCLMDRCSDLQIGADVDSYLQPARDFINWCAPAIEKYGNETCERATSSSHYPETQVKPQYLEAQVKPHYQEGQVKPHYSEAQAIHSGEMASEKPSQPGVVLSRDGKFSDLKLICQDREFEVHKIIVCDKSAVLTAACEDGFKESIENTIRIKEFDAETVNRMLDFMYTGDYDDGAGHVLDDADKSDDVEKEFNNLRAASTELEEAEGSRKPDASSSTHSLGMEDTMTRKDVLRCNVRVNAIADYYDVSSLKQCANTKIENILNVTGLIEGWADIVRTAFDSTSDSELLRIMALTSAEHIEELVELEDFVALGVMNAFITTILRKKLSAHREEVQRLNHIIHTLKSDLRTTEANLRHERCVVEQESTKFENLSSNIGSCLSRLSKCHSCRNCDAAFTCYIDGSYILRCAKCKCKHMN